MVLVFVLESIFLIVGMIYSRRNAIALEFARMQSGRNNVLVKALISSEIAVDVIDDLLSNICQRKHKMDFNMIPLIRFLFIKLELGDNVVDSYQHRIDQILCECTFWPGYDEDRHSTMRRMIFWSENHIFMYLSSAVLYRQRCLSQGLSCYVSNREEQLLMCYLEGHCSPDSVWVYEVLSPVYLPYTFSALLNLYDFSTNEAIRSYADVLLNYILYQVLLGANSDGICNLTASARSYPKFRRRNWGHNISMLVYLATGVARESTRPTAVTDFLLTSSWIPKTSTLDAFTFVGFVKLPRSHGADTIRDLYNSVEPMERVPFYWSAGLVVHPDFVEETKAYQRLYSLHSNPGIRLLDFLPNFMAKSAMESFDHYSHGQAYCSIELNLYKSPSKRVVLSSFDTYNVGRALYQQVPWMANVAGVPVWSESGRGSKTGLTNTYAPSVTQKGNILIAAYVRPRFQRESISRILVDNSTYMHWPSCYFDQEYVRLSPYHEWVQVEGDRLRQGGDCRAYSWWVGVRNESYVGILCTEPFTIDRSSSVDETLQILKCTEYKHAWICTVGDDQSHRSTQDFLNFCGAMSVGTNFSRREHEYSVTVFDGTEGVIFQSVKVD